MKGEEELRTRTWAPSDLSRIDAVCDRFEAAWEAEGEAHIDAFLRHVPEALRPRLRQELAAIAAERQTRRSDTPSPEWFAELVVNARLMTRDQWEAFLTGLPAQPGPPDVPGLIRQLVATNRLTAYQATELAAGRTDRLRFQDYVILDRIGAGGMGEVFQARHRAMDRIVALKFLSERAVHSPEAVARFQREVRAAARLSHPNIVTAYDARQQGPRHCLVMEYVDGVDLRVVVRQRGPLPVREALDCIVQAARGLEYAHHHGVIHRDIKPSNLLLSASGTVKILDMGLARVEDALAAEGAAERLTDSGQMMGTCDYMAPEQADDTRHADHRSDIYSLGCTLYCLLTGRPPYHAATPVQTLMAHQTSPIPSIRQLRPELPETVDHIFRRMAAKRPEDRYASAGEVITALETCLGRSVVRDSVAAPPPPQPPSPPPPRLMPEPPPAVPPPSTAPGDEASGERLASFLDAMAAERSDDAPTVVQGEVETLAARVGRPRGAAGPPEGRQARRKQQQALLAAGGALGLLLVLLGIGWATLGRQDPPPPDPAAPARSDRRAEAPGLPPADLRGTGQLRFERPEVDRPDTRLTINDRVYDLGEWVDQTDARTATIPLPAGSHRVRIARRGFEPFEQTVRLAPGEEIVLAPQWRALPGAALPEEPAVAQPVVDEPFAEEPDPAGPDVTEVADWEADTPAEPAPEELAALEALEAADAAWREATGASEEKAAAWDFAGALAALDGVAFDDAALGARLVRRRDELRRMAAVKERMIERIRTADPPLKKADLMLRGVGGELTGADQDAITATLATGRKESLPWHDLGTEAPGRLLQLAVDPSEADDWLSAGVFALGIGDAALAERLLARAGDMGVDIGPYQTPLADTALVAARSLLDAGEFAKAAGALASLEAKYAGTPWWRPHQSAVAAARSAAAAGLREAEAEALYTEAVEHFERNDLFELKPLLEKLRAEYSDLAASLAPAGRPPLAELEQSVATLGRRLSVRLDGKGDFRSIRAAIDAAPPHSLIEIQDGGPYNEQVEIRKVGLTLRGVAGAWPVITSLGANRDFENFVHVLGADTTLERLIIVHGMPRGERPHALNVGAAGCRIRAVMSIVPRALQSEAKVFGCWNKADALTVLADCIFLGQAMVASPGRVTNCLFVGDTNFHGACRIENCTVSKKVQFVLPGSVVRNSIIGSAHIFDHAIANFRMERCNVFGRDRFWGHGEPKTGFFFGDPRFHDPPNLDYRLMPGSPCIGKADDGGDLGVRYTPEMIEMVKVALELRARGIIRF